MISTGLSVFPLFSIFLHFGFKKQAKIKKKHESKALSPWLGGES